MAARWLAQKETADSAPFYLDLFKQPDPNLQCGALIVLSKLAPTAISRSDLLKLLERPNLDTITYSLYLLEGEQSPGSRLIWEPRRTIRGEHLTSLEAAPLTTNKLALVRLIGISTLLDNADSRAIELTRPLLEDSNALVRRRAGMLLQEVSGQDIPAYLPTRWEGWWAANKKTFKSPHAKPDSGI